jgi:hypothetical protein
MAVNYIGVIMICTYHCEEAVSGCTVFSTSLSTSLVSLLKRINLFVRFNYKREI